MTPCPVDFSFFLNEKILKDRCELDVDQEYAK